MSIRKRKKIEYIINENECYICISHAGDKDGYPRIKINKKMLRISRYFWEKKYGPIPDKMCVCHKCDTPACINVDHFFLGTKADNNHDRNKKNRQSKGEKVVQSKFTEEQVLKIRKESGSLRELGKKYRVHYTNIHKIKNKKSWKWL